MNRLPGTLALIFIAAIVVASLAGLVVTEVTPSQYTLDLTLVTDVNGIPSALVERVETITGGASAVYGADAVGGVIHCFTGTKDDVGPYLDLGFHISVAGIVTFKNADALREAVRHVPLDRLLVETDSPYLAPVPLRGRRNEPAHVRQVAEGVAAARHEEFSTIAGATTANAKRLFRL